MSPITPLGLQTSLGSLEKEATMHPCLVEGANFAKRELRQAVSSHAGAWELGGNQIQRHVGFPSCTGRPLLVISCMEVPENPDLVSFYEWNGQFLLDLGYPSGRGLGRALDWGRKLLSNGSMNRADFIQQLTSHFPLPADTAPIARIKKRASPIAWEEAIAATNDLDAANLASVRRKMAELLVTPVIEAAAIMPDACPSGGDVAAIPVGGAIAARNAVLPGAHSADIVCSMFATFFTSSVETGLLMDCLESSTRFGMGGRRPNEQVDHPVIYEPVWENKFLRGLKDYAVKHMADQGDGNHFAYLGQMEVTPALIQQLDAAGHTSLAKSLGTHASVNVMVTHHGSRGLGAQVYKRGMDAAIKHTAQVAEEIPASAAWLDMTTEEGQAYWDALQYVARWTLANHHAIHDRFLAKSGATRVDSVGNVHNFVWKRGDLYYHGKGATPAWKDEEGRPLIGLIPLNMGSEILLVLGKDQERFLSFAPHGAGRNVSRTQTTSAFKSADGELEPTKIRKAIAAATPGLDIRWYSKNPDISESPIGYKSAQQVKAQIEQFGLATIIGEIQPRGCIMAGSFPKPWELNYSTAKQRRQVQHQAERRRTRQDLHMMKNEADDNLE